MTHAPSRTPGAPATATGPSLWWRLAWSSWLLLLLLPAGSVAWAAFGLLASLGRRRSWGIAAGAYAIAAIIVQMTEDPAGSILQGTLYLVALLHGLIINQSWLLLVWGSRENGLSLFGNLSRRRPRSAAGPTRPGGAVPQEAEKLLGGGGTSRSDYVDDSADAVPPARRRRSTRAERRAATPPRAVPAPAPAELVDVNTANQRTLAKLTGMDRGLAKAAIADRAKRGGFSSLEDFAGSAGLQPHELVRLSAEAFCSPRPRAKRSFGRRVDY
ncbi:ComEA family DNA-binding protein [Cryobacterium sp. W22_MBD10_FK3]|uniref:ComEA family DNA-binding protein n=1 Tax=Cryobacterium sp. W22_MBD10_FK3 TaxID=3240273 RepID=UPI003F913741